MGDDEIVEDAVLGGSLFLRQPRRGHKAGTDAVLLAAATEVRPHDTVVDVGAGVGTVGLLLARREPALGGILLEADEAAARLAAENCRRNGADTRLRVIVADLFDRAACRTAGLADEGADVVVTNPPFLLAQQNRSSPLPEKARAHVLRGPADGTGHGDWLREALRLLRGGGRLAVIHRPDALPALLSASEGRLGGIRLLPVYAKAAAPAVRIILRGHKGSRAPLSIGRGLVLHGPDGRFTPEAEAIHRGEALLSD